MGYSNNLDSVRLLGGAALAGCVLALVWAFGIVSPVHVSKAEILVQPMAAPAFEPSGGGDDVNPGHERELIHSGGVAQLVKDRLETTATVEDLRTRVGVTVVGSTRILDLTFQASSPSEAQRGAAAYAEAYLELKRQQLEAIQEERRDSVRAALEPIEEDLGAAQEDLGSVGPATGEGLAARARVDDLAAQAAPYHENLAATQVVDSDNVGSVVSPASRPEGPVHPRPLLYGLGGASFGAGAGAALMLGRARLDRRLAGREDLEEHLGAPVLATVP
ncbi:MAG: hypothetical protein ACRDZ3_16135, partial [Acidimicrobiia bacterium]